ncbi:hypothetical protein [Hyphobacterium sp.]|uniref:hypothetical protein n=1 Tax=Hyphobacterium sp. TaxID=2004662 RepID=UPI003BA96EA9
MNVLVTGANEFLGAHFIFALAEKGYAVRGTLRVLKAAAKARVRRVVMTSAYQKARARMPVLKPVTPPQTIVNT